LLSFGVFLQPWADKHETAIAATDMSESFLLKQQIMVGATTEVAVHANEFGILFGEIVQGFSPSMLHFFSTFPQQRSFLKQDLHPAESLRGMSFAHCFKQGSSPR
jgi:hypothetical protein